MSVTHEAYPKSRYSDEISALLTHLRRIEGQVRGVQRMVEEDRYSLDIVAQLRAIAAATDKVSMQLLQRHIRATITEVIHKQHSDEAVEELLKVVGEALRCRT